MDGQGNGEVAERLGPYRLVTRIGEGGMGVVYLGLDPDRRTVAVKVLRPHVAADEVSRTRLAREVDAMRRVTSPHVAEVLDADVHGARPYVVTRYVQGRTLREVVQQDGPLTGEALTRLARGLADALVAIHAAHIVHRDVKPSNVILVDGEPVVIDFGVAQAADATHLTQTGAFIGTPAYLAPEILEGASPGNAADVHAWGAVVAFAATGRSPFGSGSYDVVFSNIAQGRADLAGIPEPLGALVRAALARDPAGRPPAAWLRERAAALDEGGGRAARFGRRGAGAWGAAAAGGSAASTAGGSPYDPPASNDVPPPPGSPAAPQPGPDRARTRAYTGQGGPRAAPYTHQAPPPGAADAETAVQPPDGDGPGTRQYTTYGAPPASNAAPPTSPSAAQGTSRPGQQPHPYPYQPAGAAPAAYPQQRPRRSRPVVGWLLLLVLAGFAGIAPVLGILAVALLVVGLRTTDGIAGGLAARRSRRGPRDVDRLLSVVISPWHLSRAAVATGIHLVLPVVTGAAIYAALRAASVGTASGAAVLGACAFVLLAFFGPGGRKPRQRAAGTLSLALRGQGVLIGTVAAAVLVLLLELSAMEGRVLVWWPVEALGRFGR